MEAAGSSETSFTLYQTIRCLFLYFPAGKECISDSYFSTIFSFFCVDMKLLPYIKGKSQTEGAEVNTWT